jgi:hypothetical protein
MLEAKLAQIGEAIRKWLESNNPILVIGLDGEDVELVKVSE